MRILICIATFYFSQISNLFKWLYGVGCLTLLYFFPCFSHIIFCNRNEILGKSGIPAVFFKAIVRSGFSSSDASEFMGKIEATNTMVTNRVIFRKSFIVTSPSNTEVTTLSALINKILPLNFSLCRQTALLCQAISKHPHWNPSADVVRIPST